MVSTVHSQKLPLIALWMIPSVLQTVRVGEGGGVGGGGGGGRRRGWEKEGGGGGRRRRG